MADINKQQQLASELASKLWACANDLRGNMDASEFKNYILGLIFYRYLSQKVENHFAEELKEDGITYEEAWNNEEYRQAIMDDSLDRLGYVIQPKYLFSNVIKMIEAGTFSIDYMEEIVNAITESTQGQPSEDAFSDLFEDMDLKSTKLGREIKQRTRLISNVLNTIDDIEFDYDDAEFDVLGTAYMTLIGNFASSAGKKGGEFYTPANMSKLVARLATVGLTDVLAVFDPACGSGSLLLEVGNCCNVRNYYGQELNSSTYNLARMNMLLHNIDYPNFKIVNCDTLTDNTHFGDEPFEVQVANPPYSLKWDSPIALLDDERYSTYGKLAPKSAADFAFVQTMIYHMKEGDSRVVVLLPHGVLFRGGAEEMIRKYMIKELNVLDAVVGLPANCFQGTSIPVCCLVFKKERNGNSNNVCFIDASKYYSAGKNMNYITDEDIDRIVDAYVERKDIDKFCHIASMDEIIENDYNLNIPRYVDTFEEEEPIDIPTVKANIAKHMEESKAIDAELEDYFKQLGI
ncbi:MAG: type I restriction-modification system subunit M [Lachnospiraceae bacterium]|jgi:type I restriction enzyme M protein|nr:type I restriction-modification system subunit M [Lachnospiraceae bacterium]